MDFVSLVTGIVISFSAGLYFGRIIWKGSQRGLMRERISKEGTFKIIYTDEKSTLMEENRMEGERWHVSTKIFKKDPIKPGDIRKFENLYFKYLKEISQAQHK